MSSVLTPPSPSEELEELCVLLGSQGAVARLLGRDPNQVRRWRKGDSEIRPGTVGLIDDAWSAVHLLSGLVGREKVGTLVSRRWPALGYKSPAQCVQAGATETLLELLREGAQRDDTANEDDFATWLHHSISAEAVAAAPLDAAELDDDVDDSDRVARPMSTAWRGGSTMASDRWFKKD
ncbi:MAG: hypothetical protein ACYC1P_13280 [Gaiellaceae bacterium]